MIDHGLHFDKCVEACHSEMRSLMRPTAHDMILHDVQILRLGDLFCR